MKQSIRNQVFETNSSSIHSLSIMNYSASEYDSVGITANNYDVLQLTAYEYDWFSNRKVTD